MADRNLVYGLCLTIFGATFSLASHFMLGNVPLTAMGIGLAVLGAAWAMTPPNSLPKDTMAGLVKSSCSNIEALLEAVGAFERAVYIPVEGRAVAYVPIKKAGAALREIAENAGKMLIRRGGSLGVILAPPMAGAGNPHPPSGLGVDGLLELALVGSEVASSVKAVMAGDAVVVDVEGVKVDVDYPRFRRVMGSLPSCLAAQAASLALSRPVQVADERRAGNRLTIRLRVLDWTDRGFT